MDYLETAIDLCRAAGDILNYYADRDKLVEFKGHANLVTIADKKSEELIIGGILSRYPSHSILAEESGATQSGAAVKWIIDPLDGTTNFAHGYPFYCVSIAVEEKGEIVCGAVYDPVREEMFRKVTSLQSDVTHADATHSVGDVPHTDVALGR